MATGANTAPLGRLHPILAAAAKFGEPKPSKFIESKFVEQSNNGTSSGSKDPELQRHLAAAKKAASALFPSSLEPPKKKRKSRWGNDDGKIAISGLPTALPANMKEEEQKLYILHLKIEENSRMLRTGDLGIPNNPGDRSPSPEPIYSHDGKRLNTREVRVRKKLEDERHDLVQKAVTLKAEYKPPPDYKPPNRKFEDKVFIPQDHHPETNFVGLLIGPRGNTLKQLEKETQTKIMIRGKGATKEGKLGRAGLPQPGEDEPLHALITGNTPEVVKGAVDKIKSIIQSGIDVPGNDNDLKKLQLQQLAELNGTFKPLDIFKCRNCGSALHKTWDCHEHQNVTSTVICSRCGGGGHIASDCKADVTSLATPVDKAKMDSEYLSLMKELGESVPDTPKQVMSSVLPSPAASLRGPKPSDQSNPQQMSVHQSQHHMQPHWSTVPSGPPLIPGPPPPPFIMMHSGPPGGSLMGGVPHPWGIPPPPPPPGAPTPLMPTPHLPLPLAPPVYPQASKGPDVLGGPKPLQTPNNPVPLLSMASQTSAVMSKSSIPLTTSAAQMTTAAPPRPHNQPPWQQPHRAVQQQPPMWQHAPHTLMYGAGLPLPHGVPSRPTSAGNAPPPPLPPPDQSWPGAPPPPPLPPPS